MGGHSKDFIQTTLRKGSYSGFYTDYFKKGFTVRVLYRVF